LQNQNLAKNDRFCGH